MARKKKLKSIQVLIFSDLVRNQKKRGNLKVTIVSIITGPIETMTKPLKSTVGGQTKNYVYSVYKDTNI